MVLKSLSGFYTRSRPRRYKARDAAYAVGGNPGFVLARRPRPYSLTRQQARVKSVAEQCGIKSGIGKAELQRLMKECVGPALRRSGGGGRRRAAAEE